MNEFRRLREAILVLPDFESRLRTALMLFPAEVEAACRVPSPLFQDAIRFLFEPGPGFNSREPIDCIPALNYCSCKYFEKQGRESHGDFLLIHYIYVFLVIQTRASIVCPHLLAVILHEPIPD